MTQSKKELYSDRERKPEILPVSSEGIPDELKALPQWVCWKLVWDTKRKRWNKEPINAVTGRLASTADPKTWSSFETALAWHEAHPGCAGTGFVFAIGGELTGIDLDDAIDLTTGALKPWAQAVVDEFGTYTELSPSGTGLKLFCKGTKRGPKCRTSYDDGEVEVYSEGRYFVVSGHRLEDAPCGLTEAQAAVDALYAELFGQSEQPPVRSGAGPFAPVCPPDPLDCDRSDDDLIAVARMAANGSKFTRLWSGDKSGYDGDDSRADAALCALLAYWCDRDDTRIDRLFRRSGLMRPKWDSPRGNSTYGAATIEKEIARCTRTRADDQRDRGPRPGQDAGAGDDPDHGFLTDMGNASRLAARISDDFRHNTDWQKWLAWDGSRWAVDDRGAIVEAAKESTLALFEQTTEQIRTAALAGGDDMKARLRELHKVQKWALTSQDARRLNAAVALARSEAGVPISTAELDQSPMLFNVANGTIDLTTGVLREHRRADLLTQMSPVEFDPDATCPTWQRFLATTFAGDGELIAYVHRLAGYCLTGFVSEQVVPIFYGSGSNGKSVMVQTLAEVLGEDFSCKVPETLLMAGGPSRHPTEVATLYGKRLAMASETNEDGKLNEARVKELSGGETLTARRCNEDFWQFAPAHKLIISTNHKPRIRGTDDGIWRRLPLIPFGVRFVKPGEAGFDEAPPERRADPHLLDKLRKERPGILAWLVAGCLAWRRDGLNPPASVKAATKNYRTSEDVLQAWLDECVTVHMEARCKLSDLFASFKSWAENNGERCGSAKSLSAHLEEKWYRKLVSNGTWFIGLSLQATGGGQSW